MSTKTYTLSAEVGVRDIEALWVALRVQLPDAGAVLELDASAVVRPDTALAQLLAVAVVRAREQGRLVRIVNPSQRLRELLSLLALDVVFGD